MDVRPGKQGVVLPGPRLALDDPAPALATIVSHAHGDHIPYDAPHVHATSETAALLAVRAPHIRVSAHPFGEPFAVGDAEVEFRPSGHVLGSAFTLVRWRGSTLLYTGDYKLREPFSCRPAERGLRCDVLVTESTFGLPVYRFPDPRRTQERAVGFAEETLAEGAVPVFLGYSLGKAQELMRLLGERGVPVMAHGAAWNISRVYAAHGWEFPQCVPYSREGVERHALVVPPGARTSPMVTRLDARVAYASGWAAVENRRVQLDADVLLPLSDHCDFGELLEFVRETKPRRVIANHGYSDVFAHILSGKGIEAAGIHAGVFEEEVGEAVPEETPA